MTGQVTPSVKRPKKGIRLFDFDGAYGDDPFSNRGRRGREAVDVMDGLGGLKALRRRKPTPAASFLRAATGSPEAMVKIASWGSGSASARDQLDYISREGELELELEDGTVIQSLEENRELVDEWEDLFRHRKDGKARNTVHFILSTPPGTDRDGAMEAARDWAKETFGENQKYAMVRHDDTDHPHVHIVSTVNGRDRAKFRVGADDFHTFRERFAEKCRDRGIEMNATRRDVRGAARGESLALRKMRDEGRTPRIDDIAARKVAEQGAGRPGERSHPAKAVRQERLSQMATEHRGLAVRMAQSVGDAPEGQRQALVASVRALSGLADHLDRGGDTARPDRVYGAERVTRETVPPVTPPAAQPAAPPGQGAKKGMPVEEMAKHTDRACEAAHTLADSLPPGERRDAVLTQLAVLEKIRDNFYERLEKVAKRDGATGSGPDKTPSVSRNDVPKHDPGQRPLTNSERALHEVRQRRAKEEQARRRSGEPDADRADWDRERDMDRDWDR